MLFACSANQIYKLSWGERCDGGKYSAQTSVPKEVQEAFANRDTDDMYESLHKMIDGMPAAEPGERWTLEQVMVREPQSTGRLALHL